MYTQMKISNHIEQRDDTNKKRESRKKQEGRRKTRRPHTALYFDSCLILCHLPLRRLFYQRKEKKDRTSRS